jgi:thiol-disulfide isomerase/thioredoxin
MRFDADVIRQTLRLLPALLLLLGPGLCPSQAQPANDMFANRMITSGTNVIVTGNNESASTETGEPAHAGYGPFASVWWTWTATTSGVAVISTAGSSFDTLLGVYTGSTVSSLTWIASNDEDPDSGASTSKVSFEVVPGQTYQIAVDGFYWSYGDIILQIRLGPPEPAPANDLFTNRLSIAGTNVVATGSNVGATSETGEPAHAGYGPYRSVWWSWTATNSGVAVISTAGSSFDTLLGVYTGSTVSNLTWIASNDEDPDSGASTSKVTFDVVPGQTYQIAVDGYYRAAGDVTLQVRLAPAQPPPPAPAWEALDLQGLSVRSTNYAGKVLLLNFWATWCGPCVAEIPDLIALQEKYAADGLAIVGASVDTTSQAVQDFLAGTPLNYQVVMANGAMQMAYGGIPYIPTTFIISRQNLIMKKYVGSQSMATFEKQIIPLLYGNTRLAAQKSGSQLLLRWPTNAVTFTLDSTPALGNSTWSAWPTLPTVANGSNTVSVPLTNSARCFRLRLPY